MPNSGGTEKGKYISLNFSDNAKVTEVSIRFFQILSSFVKSLVARNPETRNKTFPPVRLTEKYRGYFDTTMNTDNAWAEVAVLRVEIPFLELNTESVKKISSFVFGYNKQ